MELAHNNYEVKVRLLCNKTLHLTGNVPCYNEIR